MSSATLPVPPMPMRGAPLHISSNSTAAAQSTGLWDRVSTWASEHKAVVYTVAGVAIVVTATGVAYYLTDSVSWTIAQVAAVRRMRTNGAITEDHTCWRRQGGKNFAKLEKEQEQEEEERQEGRGPGPRGD